MAEARAAAALGVTAKEGRILVVDDELAFRVGMKALLEDEGFDVQCAENAYQALERLRSDTVDLVLSDLKMEGLDGLGLLSEIKAIDPDLPVLMVTGYASIDTAIDAIRQGAFDYLTKPCNNSELLLRVRRAIETRRQSVMLAHLREEVEERFSFGNIVGKSRPMQDVFRLIGQIADTDVTVLILGETGTGKELVARAIHYASPRKRRPFVGVNCSALTETLLESELFGHERGAFTGAVRQKAGRFELASGGTLFLDEVGEMPAQTQIKLLRVLQEREFERVGGSEPIKTDIRVIAATHKNLEEGIAKGTFREDLFYRLNVIPVRLPALRERLDDMPLLITHFIEKCSQRLGRKPPAPTTALLSRLMQHDWPGNIRQLENVIERAIVLEPGDTLREVDFPGDAPRRAPIAGSPMAEALVDIGLPLPVLTRRVVESVEREYLKRVLARCKGSIQQSAALAKINRRSFFAKMRAYGIRKEEFKEQK